MLHSKYGVIDSDGQKRIDFRYEDMDVFPINDGGYATAKKKNGKCGIINTKEEVILDFVYDEIKGSDNHGSLFFIVKLDNKSALFNEEGVRIA